MYIEKKSQISVMVQYVLTWCVEKGRRVKSCPENGALQKMRREPAGQRELHFSLRSGRGVIGSPKALANIPTS